jgi:uncharacterized membrane protein YciS (DUF1049 family)
MIEYSFTAGQLLEIGTLITTCAGFYYTTNLRLKAIERSIDKVDTAIVDIAKQSTRLDTLERFVYNDRHLMAGE